MEAFVPLFIFGSFAYILKEYWNYKLRKVAVDQNKGDELQKVLMVKPSWGGDGVPSSLKWGMVLTAVGGAALIGLNMPDTRDEITFSLMFLFAGLALIVYYFIASRIAKKNA